MAPSPHDHHIRLACPVQSEAGRQTGSGRRSMSFSASATGQDHVKVATDSRSGRHFLGKQGNIIAKHGYQLLREASGCFDTHRHAWLNSHQPEQPTTRSPAAGGMACSCLQARPCLGEATPRGSRVPSLQSWQSRDVCGQCITGVPLRRNSTHGQMARQKWAVRKL